MQIGHYKLSGTNEKSVGAICQESIGEKEWEFGIKQKALLGSSVFLMPAKLWSFFKNRFQFYARQRLAGSICLKGRSGKG